MIDQLAIANWQRSEDGHKNRRRPKPLSPQAKQSKRIKVGKTDRTPEEVMAVLNRNRNVPVLEPGEVT